MAKTYIIAGHDHNGAFKGGLGVLEGKEGVVILRPQPGVSVVDTIKAAGFREGDNLIVASHGVQNGIEWQAGEIVHYDAIFQALPKGIGTIVVTSCFGGSAQHSLASVPAGTLLQTLVGTETVNISSAITQFSREGATGLSPVDMFLEALDNVDANEIASVASLHASSNDIKLVSDPNKVLPHLIGIGGTPPISINLNQQIVEIGYAADNGSLDRFALGDAVEKVKARFDTTQVAEANMGEHAESELQQNIQNVGMKLQMGLPLSGIEETRIGYAISAAYMETSGELSRLTEQAKTPPLDITAIQNFLNDVGMVGVNGKPLVPDGVVGAHSRHAFATFCAQHGLDASKGLTQEARDMIATYKSGALTKAEMADIKQIDEIVDSLADSMSADQLAAVRGQFSQVRAAMMGSGNKAHVEEELGQLVSLVNNNASQQPPQTGRG